MFNQHTLFAIVMIWAAMRMTGGSQLPADRRNHKLTVKQVLIRANLDLTRLDDQETRAVVTIGRLADCIGLEDMISAIPNHRATRIHKLVRCANGEDFLRLMFTAGIEYEKAEACWEQEQNLVAARRKKAISEVRPPKAPCSKTENSKRIREFIKQETAILDSQSEKVEEDRPSNATDYVAEAAVNQGMILSGLLLLPHHLCYLTPFCREILSWYTHIVCIIGLAEVGKLHTVPVSRIQSALNNAEHTYRVLVDSKVSADALFRYRTVKKLTPLGKSPRLVETVVSNILNGSTDVSKLDASGQMAASLVLALREKFGSIIRCKLNRYSIYTVYSLWKQDKLGETLGMNLTDLEFSPEPQHN